MQNLVDVTVSLKPVIENPFVVRAEDGRLLGSAVVALAAGELHVRLILDPNHPESFDLTTEPEQCKMTLNASIQDGVLKGAITLMGK